METGGSLVEPAIFAANSNHQMLLFIKPRCTILSFAVCASNHTNCSSLLLFPSCCVSDHLKILLARLLLDVCPEPKKWPFSLLFISSLSAPFPALPVGFILQRPACCFLGVSIIDLAPESRPPSEPT